MTNYSNEACGALIRKLRKEAGIKTIDAFCEKIAEKTGVQPSSQKISDYENGKYAVPYETLIVIADILHVTVDFLLGVSNDPNPQAADASKYTGLSPQALRVLHDTHTVTPSSVSVLNDLILDPSFAGTLLAMHLLRFQSGEIQKADASIPDTVDQMIMRSKHEGRLNEAVRKQYGVAVILKNMDAIRYQESRVMNELHGIVSRVCGTSKAAREWSKKCAAAKIEFNAVINSRNGGEKNGKKDK